MAVNPVQYMQRCNKERLLQFDFRDGWKPLCEFLEKPIPDRVFPHENKKGGMNSTIWNLEAFAKMKRELHVGAAIVSMIVSFSCVYLLKTIG